MSGAAWVICERCYERCFHYSGDRCAACKRRDRAAEVARKALLLLTPLIGPCTSGCGPFVLDVDITSDGDGDSGSRETDAGGTFGATSTSGTPVSDSTAGSTDTSTDTSGTGSTDTSGTGTSESTTGDPEECVLPHGDDRSWCDAQREVAQVLGCRTSEDPPACYQAIVAQYDAGDWEILVAGDCDTAIDGPACAAAYAACTNATGPRDCNLFPHDSVETCVAAAGGSAAAIEWCEAMWAYYVLGCSQDTQYRPCDPGCGLPCAFGRECLGPKGYEMCTLPCSGAINGPCDPGCEIPCVGGWECMDGFCSIPPCSAVLGTECTGGFCT